MRLKTNILLGACFLLICSTATLADNPNALRWQSVDRIQGSFECREVSVKSRNDDPEFEKGYQEDVAVGNFVLFPEPDPNHQKRDRRWITEEATISGNSSLTFEGRSPWRQERQKSSGGFSGTAQDLSFDIDYAEGTWTFSTGFKLDLPYTVQRSFFLREHRDGNWVTESSTDTQSSVSYADSIIYGKLPALPPGPISGTWFKNEEMPDYWITQYEDCRVSLTPVIPELEVVVSIEGRDMNRNKVAYADWLPEATLPPEDADDYNPKVPGSRLQVKARLQTDTGGKAQVEVKRFVFKLNDTSREPSISLNFPPAGRDQTQPPDMRFEQTGGDLSAQGQNIAIPSRADAQGYPSAEAMVGAYDFGGWSDLTVEAELADGTFITGHLEGNRQLQLIPLPKRSGGSYIADAWKDKHGVSGPDRADDETKPEGEPGCDGDGLTLYEEYRGFFVGGRHLRCDPEKKDLFIYNECGAVAEPGIALFERLSGLKVHEMLQEESSTERDKDGGILWTSSAGINGEYDRGPHRVYQHRIEILVCDATVDRGGGTIAKGDARSGDVRLRPKDVENIFVEGPAYDFWAEQYGVRPKDKPRQFDVAMAHELFHAVGGEHHGEADGGISFDANSPDESSGGEYYWDACVTGYGCKRARLLDEVTDQDISARTARRADQVFDNPPPMPGDPQKEDSGISTERVSVHNFTVGFPHGQHSGDESCVMRYWLADIYLKQPGNEPVYYVVPDGTEPVGNNICAGTAGKSINKAGRKPQPRYFDAAPTRGNCKHWVCVNDDIPGQPSNIPEAPQ